MRGFIPPIVVPEDFVLGSGKLGSQVINPSGDWRPFLPIYEAQNRGFEPNACVSYGTLSALEILHRFHYKTEPNYSDRFLAVVSETNPNAGNTPKNVSAALRHYGAVDEEKYPYATESLDEYYKFPPKEIFDLGLDWLKQYEVGYEWTSRDIKTIKEALKRSPVGVAVDAWHQNEKGEYIKLGSPNHWCVLVAFDDFDRPVVWDTYDTGLKILEKNYAFEFPQIYKISRKVIDLEKQFEQAGFLEKIKLFIKHFFIWS